MLELLIEKMSCPTPAMAETCCRTAGRAQVPRHHVRAAERRDRRRAASYILDAGTRTHHAANERIFYSPPSSCTPKTRLDVPRRSSRTDRSGTRQRGGPQIISTFSSSISQLTTTSSSPSFGILPSPFKPHAPGSSSSMQACRLRAERLDARHGRQRLSLK